jgi:hypothetical protein
MPITIKELFQSDPISEALEKINFNFDQLILAGGGPPGPQGPPGTQGSAGPIGLRGDQWFTGPSASAQTIDHQGNDLREEDHFLEIGGTVYSYQIVGGITGWYDSGVNLLGPTGPEGPTGGSTDTTIYAGVSGNSVTPINAGWYPGASTIPSARTDFWTPRNMAKDVMWIGDNQWARTKLQNFAGKGATLDENQVPQLSIIQKQINFDGLNGLMIGAYGATVGATSSPGPEGATSDITDALNFGYIGLVKGISPTGSYDRSFRMKTFRQNIRLEAGGNSVFELFNNIELASKELSWVNNTNGQVFSTTNPQSINTRWQQTINGPFTTGTEKITSIELNSPGLLGSLWNSPVGATNNFGYISLQSTPGTIASSVAGWNPHGFGNVIIGPTVSGTNRLGTSTQQGLAIVRPIGDVITNDASIRFFGATAHPLDSTYEWSAQLGAITANRRSYASGGTGSSVDLSVIQIGSGTPRLNISSRILGGKIGINNHPLWSEDKSHKGPWFPVHFNLTSYGDSSQPVVPFPGQTSANLSPDRWLLGIDSQPFSGETGPDRAGFDIPSSGLGLAYSRSYYIYGSTSRTRNIILQTYFNSALTLAGSGASRANREPITQLQQPHIYLQTEIDRSSSGPIRAGNIGIGFSPLNPISGGTVGIEAWAKLSIQGSVAIGSVNNAWHRFDSDRPTNGLLIEGPIWGGQRLFTNLLRTSEGRLTNYGYTSIYNNQYVYSNRNPRWDLASINVDDGIWTKSIVIKDTSKRYVVAASGATAYGTPSIAGPDLKSGLLWKYQTEGIDSDPNNPDERGRTYLVTPNNVADGSTRIVDGLPVGGGDELTGGVEDVAYSSNRSYQGKNANQVAYAFVASKRFVTAPAMTGYVQPQGKVYTLQDIIDRSSFINGMGFSNSSWNLPLKQQWLKIPSSNSLVVLDFDGPATYGCWLTNGNFQPKDNVARYLNGIAVTANPPLPNRNVAPGSWQITIDPGTYDGQRLTILFKGVNAYNSVNGTVIPSTPLQNYFTRLNHQRIPGIPEASLNSTTNPLSTPTNITTNSADYLIMSRDFYGQTGYNPNNPTPTTFIDGGGSYANNPAGYVSTINGPAGYPFNLPYGIHSVMHQSKETYGGTAQVFDNWYSTGAPRTIGWSTSSVLNSAGSLVGVNGDVAENTTGGTMLLSRGWKIINFVWMNDYSQQPGESVNNFLGGWYETGREHIAPRYGTTYVQQGPKKNLGEINYGGALNALGGRDLP